MTEKKKSLFRPVVDAMSGYVPGEQPKNRRYIKLNTNENPFPPSPKVKAAYSSILVDGFRLYSDPVADELRDAAATAFGVESREWIIAGNGSDDILTIAIRSFVEQGGEAAALHPSYSLYPVLATIQGAKCRLVSLLPDFSLPNNLIDRIAGTSILFLTRPNAPTGNAFPLETVEEICAGFEGVVLIDEAYADFASDNCLHLPAKYPNVIVSRTLSKSYALAGMRVGFGIASPRLISGMMKVKDSYNLNRVSQTVGKAALEDTEYLQTITKRIISSRQSTIKALSLRGFTVIPSETNFLFARPPKSLPADRLFAALREGGILVRYFGKDPRTDAYVRITVGTEEEMASLIAEIDRILAG